MIFWYTYCVDYLKNLIENANTSLGMDKSALKNQGDMHISYSSSYIYELDITEELGEKLKKRFQKLIGVMHW